MYFFEVWPSASCNTHQSGSIWHCHRITEPPRLEMTPEVTQSNHPPNFSHWIPSLGTTSEPFLCTCREISIQKAARSSCRRPALLVAVHFYRWDAESLLRTCRCQCHLLDEVEALLSVSPVACVSPSLSAMPWSVSPCQGSHPTPCWALCSDLSWFSSVLLPRSCNLSATVDFCMCKYLNVTLVVGKWCLHPFKVLLFPTRLSH